MPSSPLSSSAAPRTSRARIEAPTIEDDRLLGYLNSLWNLDDEEDDEWSEQSLTATAGTTLPNESQPSATAKPSGMVQLHLHQSSSSPITSHSASMAIPETLKKTLTKTGTTIAGCICRGHVILAADTRATEGTYVADKGAQKLHPLAQNAWCAGAGTSADLEMITRYALYSMALDRLQSSTIGNDGNSISDESVVSKRVDSLYTTPEKEEEKKGLLTGQVSVEKLTDLLQDRLYEGQGNIGANLIMGVVYKGRPHLRAIHPHGSVDIDLPFAALGSGGLAAMSMLEQGYHGNLTVPEAVALVQKAIVAGIQNDLGSGSQVDLCVIAPNGTSTHTRCTVPSQVLEDDEFSQDTVGLSSHINEGNGGFGTNGFGNTPFAVLSKRSLLRQNGAADKTEELTKLLGLSNPETK